MRAVVQRARHASVRFDGEVVAEIGTGVVVLLGVASGDTEAEADRLAGKIARLRMFENEDALLARSLRDDGGEALAVSQFTLIADTQRGNRPSFTAAASPEQAEPLYAQFCDALAAYDVLVKRGMFGARMLVSLANDGPVTIVLDG
jgi:D-tyrosyl-tRNA(Tyr) deacylase